MNDVDFDELDKAISGALAEKKTTKPDLIVHSPQSQPPQLQDNDEAGNVGADNVNPQASDGDDAPSASADAATQDISHSQDDTSISSSSQSAPLFGTSDQPTISARVPEPPTPVDTKPAEEPVIEPPEPVVTPEAESKPEPESTPEPQLTAEPQSQPSSSTDDSGATAASSEQSGELAEESLATLPFDDDATNPSTPTIDFPESDFEMNDEPAVPSESESKPPESEPESLTITDRAHLDTKPTESPEITLPEPQVPATSVPVPIPPSAPSAEAAKSNPNLPMRRQRGKFMDIAAPTTQKSKSTLQLMPLSSDEFKSGNDTSPVAEVEASQSLSSQFAATPPRRDEEPSPFVPDVSVEKRPLGGFGAHQIDKDKNDEAKADTDTTETNTAATQVPADQALAPEMSHEFVALEENEDQFSRRWGDVVNMDSTTEAESPKETKSSDQSFFEEPEEFEESTRPVVPENHFAFTEGSSPAAKTEPTPSDTDAPAPESDANQSQPESEIESNNTSSSAPEEKQAPVPLLKSLPEKEVPAGGSIIQQHNGEMTAPLNKSSNAPSVPLLSAENYHPIPAEHHTAWWVWLLVIIGVLAIGALTGVALFMFNPGLF